MKKITILLVIIFTFLFSTTSWGEWSLVTENEGGNSYYDKDIVRKSGKYLYFWMLLDFLKPINGDLSFNSYTQLDCSIFRYKTLKLQSYNKSMGRGIMTTDKTPKGERGELKYPQPESTFEIMFNKICEEQQ